MTIYNSAIAERAVKYMMAVLLFAMSAVRATGQDITFQSITPDKGLSQITVTDLYRDERGFIWIATHEGANCYNGNSIQTYKSGKDDPHSLFSNNVLKITGDGNGKVYLLCIDGIAEWDMKKEIFSTKMRDSRITAIYYNEALYIARNNEVLVFGEDNKPELFYRLPNADDEIAAIHMDAQGVMWIGTSNRGLYRIDQSRRQTGHPIEKGRITSIYADRDGELWVGSREDGLYQIKGDRIIRFVHDPLKSNTISSNFVRASIQDNQGNIWIGTFAGLDRLDKQSGRFRHYSPGANTRGMTHYSIWAMIKDHQGSIWLGTYFGGVNYFNPDYEIYTNYTVSSQESRGLSSPVVGTMTEDDNHNLWICTEGGGVNVYNRETKTFKWYRHHENRNSISHNHIKAIYYDRDNERMWIGTHREA